MWKFLNHAGQTVYNGTPFQYNLPSEVGVPARTMHPWPSGVVRSELSCGPGSLHLMKTLDTKYAPSPYVIYFARGVGPVIGEDEEKARYLGVDLWLVTPAMFHKWLRRIPEPVFLRDYVLQKISLAGCNLTGSRFSGCKFRWVDSADANLSHGKFGECVITGSTGISERCNFSFTRFERCSIEDFHARDSDFGHSEWGNTTWRVFSAHGCDFRRSSFSMVDWEHGSLYRSNFRSARIRHLRLTHGSLTMDGCELENACILLAAGSHKLVVINSDVTNTTFDLAPGATIELRHCLYNSEPGSRNHQWLLKPGVVLTHCRDLVYYDPSERLSIIRDFRRRHQPDFASGLLS